VNAVGRKAKRATEGNGKLNGQNAETRTNGERGGGRTYERERNVNGSRAQQRNLAAMSAAHSNGTAAGTVSSATNEGNPTLNQERTETR